MKDERAEEAEDPTPLQRKKADQGAEVLEESEAEESDDDIQMILNGPPVPPSGYNPANDNTDHDEDMTRLGTPSMTPC